MAGRSALENRLRSMPITGVIPEPAVTISSCCGIGIGSTKSPAACCRWTIWPRLGAVHQVLGDDAAGDRLDGDADVSVGTGAVGQRVAAPQADTVDIDADLEVLARRVPEPVPTGLDHDGRRVGGLGVDGDDPAAQVGARPQRVEAVEDVVDRERRHRGVGQRPEAAAQAAGLGAPEEERGGKTWRAHDIHSS